MKLPYGIAGFVIGLLSGLLLAIIEIKLMKRLQQETLLPFVIGITVIASVFSGILIGVKIGKRY